MNSTKKVTVSQAAQLLAEKNSFALFAHTNPDGDTLGACIALCIALRKLDKNVRLFCDMPISDKLKAAFPEMCEIVPKYSGKYDMLVAVDCGDLKRVGESSDIYGRFSETLTLDHHGGDYFSKYNLVTRYASTCQIVYEIVRQLPLQIDERLATFLYMGLCTDTGNFSHNNTDKASFLMAADLCEKGADMEKINRVFFKDTTLSEVRILGRAIDHMRTFYDGQMVLMYLTESDLKECGADFSETSWIVQHAIDVDTAKVGVMLTEYGANVYKVSMRGKNYSVRDVCQQFDGGGHMYASGCMISGFLEDVIEKIVRTVGFTI